MLNDALWAPWRMAYLRDLERRESAARAAGESLARPTNFLADYWAHPERDQESLVVHRDASGMILLNRYPYVNGHLLVALGEPKSAINDYGPAQRAAFWQLVECAVDLVQRTLEPQGINIGLNQGRAAGAGLPEHIHAHVLPRWNGDTNFMATVGQVRVIPDALESMWATYRANLRG
ncbi:MAG: HIT domain-containing protein [Phycisphaerales bacterium]